MCRMAPTDADDALDKISSKSCARLKDHIGLLSSTKLSAEFLDDIRVPSMMRFCGDALQRSYLDRVSSIKYHTLAASSSGSYHRHAPTSLETDVSRIQRDRVEAK